MQDPTKCNRAIHYLLFVTAILAFDASFVPNFLLPREVQAQAAAPQDDLPEAPNKALVVSKCTRCHASQIFSSHRQTSKAWDETISQMQAKGLVLTDDEYDKVLAYLSTNLAPPQPSIDRTVSTR